MSTLGAEAGQPSRARRCPMPTIDTPVRSCLPTIWGVGRPIFNCCARSYEPILLLKPRRLRVSAGSPASSRDRNACPVPSETCGRGVGRPSEDLPELTLPTDQAQPSERLIPTPQRREAWPLGSGSALISSTWYRLGSLERIAGSIASKWSTSTIGSCPLRLMR